MLKICTLAALAAHMVVFNMSAQSTTAPPAKSPVKAGAKPNNLAAFDPIVLPPEACTGEEASSRTSSLLFRQVVNSQNQLFNTHWLGRNYDPNGTVTPVPPIENNYLGINTSTPSSVLDVHIPQNRRAQPIFGLSVTTGLQCSKVGLVAGDNFPSWVGSYSHQNEEGHPFQVRAGFLNESEYWDPATGTFIHLDPANRRIGIMTDQPQYPLDVNGTIHTNQDQLVQQVLAVGQAATIGYGSQNYNTAAPTEGLIVNGNVGIGTTNPTAKTTIAQASNAPINSLLKLSNLFNGQGLKENQILLDNGLEEGTPPYQAWRIGAATVAQNYFRISNTLGTRNVPTQELLTIDGETGNLGITNPAPLAKLHITTSRTGPGDIDMITLSNRFELTETGTKEPTISFDNGQPTPIGWKLSASVINEDYFRIRKHDIGAERTHLLINQLGQTQLSSRITAGTQNRALRISNLFDGPIAPSVENQISIDNGQADPTGWLIGAGVVGQQLDFRISSELGGQATEHMRILRNGNVGIGTSTPASKVEISTTGSTASILTLNGEAQAAKGIQISDNGTVRWRISEEANSEDLVIGDGTLANSIRLKKQFSTGPARVVIGAQDVAINGGFQDIKLACSGTGIFKELGVLPGANWADYVFEKDYQLMPLDSLSKYINQNHHLPEVPTASEVAINGIKLAEMNAILLKKIEELTLHLIKLNKEVDFLKGKK